MKTKTGRFLRRFFSCWQGLLAGIVAVLIFLASPIFIRKLDPTAGLFDAGFLQWVLLAMVIFFFGIFLTWIGWQLAFRSMDRWADEHLSDSFAHLPELVKNLLVQISFAVVLFYWIACLRSVPLQ